MGTPASPAQVGNIDPREHRIDDRPLPNRAWEPDQKRNATRLIIRSSLLLHSMAAAHLSMIREKGDDGILSQTGFIQEIQNSPLRSRSRFTGIPEKDRSIHRSDIGFSANTDSIRRETSVARRPRESSVEPPLRVHHLHSYDASRLLNRHPGGTFAPEDPSTPEN